VAPRTRRSTRRTEALSRERIVSAAVELLDAAGEGGLTFRALTEHLATGPGAIYWHVANKDELLGAATDALVADALAVGPVEPNGTPESQDSPHDRIRAVALGLYDVLDDHPWLATQLSTQLSRDPSGSVTTRIFESLGRPIRALGAPESIWFVATSALMYYVLGAGGQNAANARIAGPDADRAGFLDAASSGWEALDPDDYPFTRAVAEQLRDHDDREQFLAGITLILAGVTATHPAAPG
jgi:AcrR family transcriptional regulator